MVETKTKVVAEKVIVANAHRALDDGMAKSDASITVAIRNHVELNMTDIKDTLTINGIITEAMYISKLSHIVGPIGFVHIRHYINRHLSDFDTALTELADENGNVTTSVNDAGAAMSHRALVDGVTADSIIAILHFDKVRSNETSDSREYITTKKIKDNVVIHKEHTRKSNHRHHSLNEVLSVV